VAVRAVLDTQVVVRGLLGIRRSSCALVFEALADGVFTAIVSPYILDELRAVLALPRLRARYGLTDDQAAELLDAYGRQAEAISGMLALPAGWRSVGSDPAVPTEDVPIVSAALEGGADYIVSDDAGLLELKTVSVAGFQPVQVVAPGPFSKQVLQLEGGQAVPSPVKPSAVLDTNVLLAIYSWHDLLDAMERTLGQDPTANLTHADIQFWAQRARAAFILALFFNERRWATWSPPNELTRTLMSKAPPVGEEHGPKSNFVRLFVYFIKEKLLPDWLAGGDRLSDESIIGNGVDELCLNAATEHSIPLVSWDGHGPNGLDPQKFISREARERGIDLVTPEELLSREKFDPTKAVERFFARWDRHAPVYIFGNPGARETLEYFRHFYRRMAEDDWTP